jgi:hypothetical protein
MTAADEREAAAWPEQVDVAIEASGSAGGFGSCVRLWPAGPGSLMLRKRDTAP